MRRLTILSKLIILILVAGALVGISRVILNQGGHGGMIDKLMPQAATKDAVVPNAASLPEGMTNGTASIPVGPIVLPGSDPSTSRADEVRILGYAWNAQQGLLLANGGVSTTAGSLMEKNNVKLRFIRQDDNDKMQESLVAFATGPSRTVIRTRPKARSLFP